jgi:hypothetical protein
MEDKYRHIIIITIALSLFVFSLNVGCDKKTSSPIVALEGANPVPDFSTHTVSTPYN